MKQKISLFIVLAMVATIMTSCFNSESEVVFDEADLLGLWQEEGTEAFVRFTAEQDDNNEYKYGCEWDEAEDVLESDLIPYGNGWFKYKLVKSDLTEIHLMDNGGADIPKIYTVVELSDVTLKYKVKDSKGALKTFAKVVER